MTDGTDTGAAPAPAAPPAASSAPAARQGAIADNTYQRLSQADQARYAQVRAGPDGGSEWVDRSTLPSATDAPSTAPADPGKPADPNARHRFGDTEFSEQEMRDFLTARADAELRKANLPASPENYEAKLPDGFKAPEGIDIKIDTTAPEYLDAAKWAHAKGLGQQEFSEMLSLHASLLARQEAAIDTARRVEVAKLGANGTARVTSLETWLRGMVGDEIAGQMRSVMATERIVRGYEMLQQKFSSQGVATFSQSHREPGQANNGRVSDEAYRAMSPGEKLTYSRGFDQSQFKEAR
jgi:hypothetical protein